MTAPMLVQLTTDDLAAKPVRVRDLRAVISDWAIALKDDAVWRLIREAFSPMPFDIVPEGCVYFAQVGDDGAVKVGSARDVHARLTLLQCGCPDEIRLVLAIVGGRHLEHALQKILRPWKRRGEWFNWTPPVRDLVFRLAMGRP